MNYVIAGFPGEIVLEDLSSLYSTSPVAMYPPIGYFSPVLSSDQIFTPGSPWSLEDGPPFEPYTIDFTFGDFRHVYNPKLGYSQFVGRLTTDSPWPYLASAHLGLSQQEGFKPYFLVMKDGMQSSKTKNFCLSVSNYLATKTFQFQVQPTSMSNIVGNFSPEVENVFS